MILATTKYIEIGIELLNVFRRLNEINGANEPANMGAI